MIQNLRRHVERSANNRLKNSAISIIKVPCKTKITDFKFSILNQNVGWLEVSMHDILATHILKPSHNILKKS